MKRYSTGFKALWTGEIVSEFAGTAGGIINGLLLYEITGSKEWMGALWLIYFMPSLILQSVSAPFLNHVVKEKLLKNMQLIRAVVYLFPLLGYAMGNDTSAIIGLIILQCTLGLVQPIYASLSFSLVPDLCKEEDLVNANGLLDGTMRLMSFLAPGMTSLFLFLIPMHYVYVLSAFLFLLSYASLARIELPHQLKGAVWTRKFWWSEMKEGYKSFFSIPVLVRLTFLSSLVQFAVGAAMVLSVPFIRSELNGEQWEYAIFAGSFPAGYAIGTILLRKIPRTSVFMYAGLIGGGLSFSLLFLVDSIYLAWLCELFGGIMFPLFNAQSASIFQQSTPRDRLSQLSSVRLLFLRITMPLGILFSSVSMMEMRYIYLIIGSCILIPGTYYLIKSMMQSKRSILQEKT
ncbi:MFS transporter [Bacillus haikouensis]|uniref:MFS transporter n=1 Tax=Bacillus haikouensis TaxID=1510468 RepID=UPI0015572C7F|nr:MFS transporter [Bacillus haikouensis]NQD64438.1 MFS transporter [Bacillus haikouensis]